MAQGLEYNCWTPAFAIKSRVIRLKPFPNPKALSPVQQQGKDAPP